MFTTIQISDNVKAILDKMKVMPRETYNEVLEVLTEDHLELKDSVKKELEERKKGKFIPHEEVKKRFGL